MKQPKKYWTNTKDNPPEIYDYYWVTDGQEVILAKYAWGAWTERCSAKLSIEPLFWGRIKKPQISYYVKDSAPNTEPIHSLSKPSPH